MAGITVNPGGVFNFNGSLSGNDDNLCKIENAEVAVNAIGNGSGSLNPSIYLNHVTFNNNLISTKLTDDNYGSTFLRSCKYECESAYLTKAPHQGVYPQNHILLEDVTEVTIGGSGNVPNTFTDIYSGIKMVRSNAYVLASHFKDLKNNNVGPSQNGIGIITENSTNVTCTLEVGAATQFKNLHRGIFSRGNFNIDIHNVVYFRDIDDISIALFHSNYNNKVVIDNVEDFSRTNIGVLVSGKKFIFSHRFQQ
ncbi:MAG: hypothetical protein IPP71_20585 [Bacteroidetes bacterium]|nr:hypothetical protein [Bacteroidota bacterium]